MSEVCDIAAAYANDKFPEYHVFFIQKPEPVQLDQKSASEIPVYKDGIHMLIPDVWLTKGVKKYIIQEILDREYFKKRIFNDVDHIDDPNKMLDKMSPSVPVHFLGSSKPGRPPYKLVAAFRFDDSTFTPDFVEIPLDTLSKWNLTYELSLGFMLDTIGENPTWLKKRKVECKPYLETKIKLMTEKTAGGVISDDELFEVENTVDILTINNPEANYLKQLLGIIDISYATDYEKWFKVICAIAHTSQSYKSLAIWFSHRNPKAWSPTEIERIWGEALRSTNHQNPVTKRSIIHWANESAPEQFNNINKENYVQILSRFVYTYEGSIGNGMVAKVMHAMLRNKFTVALNAQDKFIWYEFVCSGQTMKAGEIYKWRPETNPVNLHLYITDHIPKIYFEQSQRIKDRKEAADSEALTKYWSKIEKVFKVSEGKLFDDQFQNKVITQAIYRFYDRTFTDQLDSYEDIIGVGNGILKLGINPTLITGFHEYKISKYTPVNYVPFDPNNTYIKTLLGVFRDIFIEEDVFEFAMFHAATALDKRESAFLIWLIDGGGGNGKTTYTKMIMETMTEMFVVPGKAGLLVDNFERGNEANSAQMHLKGKNCVPVDEFTKGAVLNTTRIKTLTGGARQTGRDLHEKQSTFKTTCNIVALNNHGYSVDSTDWGTFRRIYYYLGKAKFTENPDPNNPYEKQANLDVEKKYPNDPNYREAMLSIMTHYWSKLERLYDGQLRKVPVPTIVRETEQWRNKQDTISKYICEMIVISPNASDMTLEKVCISYIDWLNKNGKKNMIQMDEVRTKFENSRLAKVISRINDTSCMIRGCRIRANIDEALDEGESMFVSL
jgi:phage/plasmid-associated DNA primase